MAKGETLTGLAVRSSQSALAMAGIQPDELDLIIFATSSPDDLFGSACEVHECCCSHCSCVHATFGMAKALCINKSPIM